MKLNLILIFAFTILLISCSNGDQNALIPAQDNSSHQYNQLGITVSDYHPDGSPAAGMGTLGLFNLSIDPVNATAELTLLRKTSLVDVLEVVDITNFLRLAPCTDCVKIQSVSLDDDGNVVVSIGIKHPFEEGDPFKPITGRNRGDLHVFNVEGTIISNSGAEYYPGIGITTSSVKLLNADGYSPYIDSVIDEFYPTDANIHPYITHFDDYSAGNFDPLSPTGFTSVVDPPPSGNLVMAMGSDYDFQDYIFSVDNDHFDFIFAVGCTYAVSSAAKSERFNPEYRVPQHNKKAASEIQIEIVENNLAGGSTESSAQIEIHVVDISHGVGVGDALDEMFADSSVGSVIIELPGVMLSPLYLDGSSYVSGTGHNPSDPLVYQAIITNAAGAPEGWYRGLIKVTDTYSPGLNSSPLLGEMDGIKRVSPVQNPLEGLFAIPEFATYQTFDINVESGNHSPVAILLSQPDPAIIEQLDTVDFDATTSYDPDGEIVLYEFDFNWDGIEDNFTADESNITGLWSDVQFVDIGEIRVGLRVTDDFGAVDYDSVIVTVSEITNIIYVDDSYIGPPHDGTMAHPFNTIQEGLEAASPGYQVWVDDSGNDYIGPITTKSGVILRSVNWDTTDGGDMASIYIPSTGYIVTVVENSTIDGFKIHGPNSSGALINGAEAVMKNCLITNIRAAGGILTALRANNSPGALIEGCEITDIEHHTSTGGIINGIYLMNSPLTLRNTRIHDIRKTESSGIVNNIYVNNCLPETGYNLEIIQNEIHNIRMPESGFIIGIYLNGTDEARINNNLIYDIKKESGGANIGIYVNGATNTEIINNTMYDFECDTFNMGIYMNDYDENSVTGTNNIIQYLHRTDDSPNGWAVYFDATNPTITWNYNNSYQITYSVPSGTGNISEDSLFVDPISGNFQLQSGSPCKNTGDPNIQNPDSTRSDMGCYGGPLGHW